MIYVDRQRFLGAFCDTRVAVVVASLFMVVFFCLLVISGRSKVGAVVVVLFNELARDISRLVTLRVKLILLVLNHDNLGLDRWPWVRHGRCIALVVEVRLRRRWKVLPWVEGKVLRWFPILGVVGSLCNLSLRWGRADHWSRGQSRSVRDNVLACSWRVLVGRGRLLVSWPCLLPSLPCPAVLLAVLLLQRASGRDVAWLVTVIANSIRGCGCHQCAFHGVVGAVTDAQVG